MATNEIILEEVGRFRIHRREPVEFGAFFLVRSLYALEADGRAWQKNIFAVAVGVLTVAAIALDCVALVFVWFGKLTFYILRSLWDVVIYAAKVVLNKLFGTALKWIVIVLIALTLYLKWHEIAAIIASWHL
ncbi:MAG: hypothetical protein J6Q03_00125 [Paludibacteraceae bacterium]|nr:hypothetical protein [Paludibacteraceae bacterium]MBO6102664.1 hypothetical protein [Opitutales bacterium]MBO7144256.1 hypothetical protein [Salinivirgaceae bacterium]